MRIGVAGAGAFGSALAIAMAADGKECLLWGRDLGDAAATRRPARLRDAIFPAALQITDDIAALDACDTVLLAVPAQALRGFLTGPGGRLGQKALVACCKGIDLETLNGPVATIRAAMPDATAAILTGPSFAADIARGMPTALTLATGRDADGQSLQQALSTDSLRIYRSTDTIGAELGGALKNVVAIACGATIGAGLGDSARAALLTRGFAEMQRVAAHLGADPQTLAGLSGLGDLALTCTSDLSRNYRHGLALGRGAGETDGGTVEGRATAQALVRIAARDGLDLPVCAVVDGLVRHELSLKDALQRLLSRPLRAE